MAWSSRNRWLAVCAPPVALVAIAIAIYQWVHIDVPARLGDEARAAITKSLRASLFGDQLTAPEAPELRRRLPSRGPLIVGVWSRGVEQARALGYGETIGDAVAHAARELDRYKPQLAGKAAGVRFKIDLVVGRGPFIRLHPVLTALAIHPGIDGLVATTEDQREHFLLPADLVDGGMLMAGAPVKHVDFQMGLHWQKAALRFAKTAGVRRANFEKELTAVQRFRVDSWVEGAEIDAPTERLSRASPTTRPPLTAETLRDAAVAGGKYLTKQLNSRGRYIYRADLAGGRRSNPDGLGEYSIPRHAGTTYFLAELYRITGHSWLREPIERAIAHLQELVKAGGCFGVTPTGNPYACVIDRGHSATDLGSTALAVVALAEYQRATGRDTYTALAIRLTEWMLWMQRSDGSFTHRFVPKKAFKDEKAHYLYYDGEAALALARMFEVTKDERYRDAAERALDKIVGSYDYFLGGFFYGEEHWTCIAAEAAYPAVDKPAYRDFCNGYGRFLRAQQLRAGDFPGQDDLVGSYMFTPYAMPQNTPTGSRTESMLSAYLLARHHGEEDPAMLEQIKAAMHFSLGQQVRPGFDWFGAGDIPTHGAIATTPVDRVVRIDYVQHVCSAMLRTAELLDELDTAN